jgi:uncharacterized protein DUF3179
LEMDGTARAYPWDSFVKQSPVIDRVHGTPLLVALGPDKKSFRVFVSRVEGQDTDFFLKADSKDWLLVDSATASEWNFQGCATAGTLAGKCLERVPALKDYWFDWRNYHADTTIYKR